MSSLFDAVIAQSRLTDSVIVSFSGGKDSVATLDLCSRYFRTVHAFFMYQVPDLSFQEAELRWAEKKYGIEILRLPHFELSDFYRMGLFCRFDGTIPLVKITDVYAHVRSVFGTHWIAAGERAKDSVVRGAMIKRSGSVDLGRGRFFPLAYWSKAEVLSYIEHRSLKVSPESRVLGHSFRSFDPGDVLTLKENYPSDYDKVVSAFPLVGAAAARAQLYGKDVTKVRRVQDDSGEPRAHEASGIRDGAYAPFGYSGTPTESANHF